MKLDTHELDARGSLPEPRLRRVLDTFESLGERESFVLRTDYDPRPVFEALRLRHRDTLGWSVVSKPPSDWEIEISRLQPKDEERKLGAYFERDHAEIDVLFDHVCADLAAASEDPPERPGLLDGLDEFEVRLERHIRWEEEILFPAVEAKRPDLAGGPGRVMREEHERIRDLKRGARSRLAGRPRDPGAIRSVLGALEELHQVLVDHNLKEEAVYYPASDDLIPAAEAAELLRRIRELIPGGKP